MAVVGRDDVAELAHIRNDLLRRTVALDQLVGDHGLGVDARPVPVDDERTLADVAHRGAKAEPVDGLAPSPRAGDHELRRGGLVEVGQSLRCTCAGRRALGDRKGGR